MVDAPFDDLFGGSTKPKRKRPSRKKATRKKSTKGKKKAKDVTEAEPITTGEQDKIEPLVRLDWFFERVAKQAKTPIYVGIDPGSDGALGFIHPTDKGRSMSIDIPTLKVSTTQKTKSKKAFRQRTVYDNGAVWELFRRMLPWRNRIVVCLEKQQARATDNGMTAFAIATGYAMWPLFLHSHGFELEEARPQDWKKAMGLTGEDKERSRLMAQRLFPAAHLFRKGDHNRAESLLIAEHFRRTRGGK